MRMWLLCAARKVALLAFLLLPTLTACEAVRVETPFDAKAAALVQQKGTGRIEGEAFLRRDYGRIVTGAGERVYLMAATPYAVERFQKMFRGEQRAYFGPRVEDTPPEYFKFRRETKMDSNGKFSFENVAAGRYIVASRVFWTEPDLWFTQGGALYDSVDVREGETAKAILSGR
jgi:hypothetical protein